MVPSEQVRDDIATTVAEAVTHPIGELRGEVERRVPGTVADGASDVAVIIEFVRLSHHADWHDQQVDRSGVTRKVDGCIVATIGDLDELAGRPARPLDGRERECLAEWRAQLGHEAG